VETALAPFIRDTPEGREADAILRACVHCGFCTATCPTYQLLGDELDGPRGRIYLIKQVLEGAAVTATTQLHLDRCLTCRSCETTCPSGVRYGRLVDIGRRIVDERVGRTPTETARRYALRKGLLSKSLFGAALAAGRLAKSFLPSELGNRIPDAPPAGIWPSPRHARRMVIAQGCVQPALAPNVDAAMARVLDRVGISAIKSDGGGCCGALPYHLSEHGDARAIVRRNVDAWWAEIERGAEAIVVTASACGVMVKDSGYVMQDDAAYAARAEKVASLARDPIEVVRAELGRVLPLVAQDAQRRRIAFHPPCTLQHGMQIRGHVEKLLKDIGFELAPVPEAHLCCGSAGTYSILQPAIAGQLRANKVKALESGRPDEIATANIGCMSHLAAATQKPVRHWVELLDARMRGAGSG
jgi:glycolate oxidase iron-sulfur subunit